ncbi:MAG: protein kinase [Woeseiaceae bacterium]|nr:protein kinase [Woeseiaceae bacterium]
MTAAKQGHEQQIDRTNRRLIAGRYRLNARIGRGRIGDIYVADDEQYRDVDVGRRVAIQLLPGRIAQNNTLLGKLKLSYAEIQAASHPNIVSYVDVDHDERLGYLVMDYLDGASLRFVLNDVSTLSWYEASPVIRAIGDALQFLHAKSIVHGQLTAENVFITEELDVRLLDVVPLEAALPTRRDPTSKDVFGRCSTKDDVCGLACLTYEMLTGRHPFNFLAAADARRAGIEVSRIDSLPDKHWDALRRALSVDREQQTPTVADFLRGFGITGTERLQPAARSSEAPPSVSASNQITSETRVDAQIAPIAKPNVPRGRHTSAKRLPSPILIVILVGLGIWFGYGQPQKNIAALADYVDVYLAGRIVRNDDVSLPINVRALNVAPAPFEAPKLLTEEAATVLVDEPLEDAETDARLLDDVAEINVEADTPASAVDVAVASRPVTEFSNVRSYIILSERDVAARITARRPGNPAERVFWWTGDRSAIADEDYIPLSRPVEGFTSGEVFETISIPLINDSLPEARETFFVFLGRHDARLDRFEPILRIRVDISDDD